MGFLKNIFSKTKIDPLLKKRLEERGQTERIKEIKSQEKLMEWTPKFDSKGFKKQEERERKLKFIETAHASELKFGFSKLEETPLEALERAKETRQEKREKERETFKQIIDNPIYKEVISDKDKKRDKLILKMLEDKNLSSWKKAEKKAKEIRNTFLGSSYITAPFLILSKTAEGLIESEDPIEDIKQLPIGATHASYTLGREFTAGAIQQSIDFDKWLRAKTPIKYLTTKEGIKKQAETDKMFLDWTNKLNKETAKKVEEWNVDLSTKTEFAKFLYDVGGAAPSIALSVGLSVATGIPAISGVTFGLIQEATKYNEYRSKGLSPSEAFKYAFPAGATEATIEFIGMNYFLKRSGGLFARTLSRSLSEGFQEGSQQAGENIWDKMAWDDKRKLFDNVFRAALLGMVVSAPISFGVSFVERKKIRKIATPDYDKMVKDGKIEKLKKDGTIPKNYNKEDFVNTIIRSMGQAQERFVKQEKGLKKLENSLKKGIAIKGKVIELSKQILPNLKKRKVTLSREEKEAMARKINAGEIHEMPLANLISFIGQGETQEETSENIDKSMETYLKSDEFMKIPDGKPKETAIASERIKIIQERAKNIAEQMTFLQIQIGEKEFLNRENFQLLSMEERNKVQNYIENKRDNGEKLTPGEEATEELLNNEINRERIKQARIYDEPSTYEPNAEAGYQEFAKFIKTLGLVKQKYQEAEDIDSFIEGFKDYKYLKDKATTGMPVGDVVREWLVSLDQSETDDDIFLRYKERFAIEYPKIAGGATRQTSDFLGSVTETPMMERHETKHLSDKLKREVPRIKLFKYFLDNIKSLFGLTGNKERSIGIYNFLIEKYLNSFTGTKNINIVEPYGGAATIFFNSFDTIKNHINETGKKINYFLNIFDEEKLEILRAIRKGSGNEYGEIDEIKKSYDKVPTRMTKEIVEEAEKSYSFHKREIKRLERKLKSALDEEKIEIQEELMKHYYDVEILGGEIVNLEESVEKIKILNKVKTGKSVKLTLYRGTGKGKTIFSPYDINTLGKALYYSITPEYAKKFGEDISKAEVTLKKPYVIRNDNDLRALRKATGAEYVISTPTSFENAKENKRILNNWITKTRNYLADNGYDSVVIDFKYNYSKNRMLANMFDESQVIKLETTKKKDEKNIKVKKIIKGEIPYKVISAFKKENRKGVIGGTEWMDFVNSFILKEYNASINVLMNYESLRKEFSKVFNKTKAKIFNEINSKIKENQEINLSDWILYETLGSIYGLYNKKKSSQNLVSIKGFQNVLIRGKNTNKIDKIKDKIEEVANIFQQAKKLKNFNLQIYGEDGDVFTNSWYLEKARKNPERTLYIVDPEYTKKAGKTYAEAQQKDTKEAELITKMLKKFTSGEEFVKAHKNDIFNGKSKVIITNDLVTKWIKPVNKELEDVSTIGYMEYRTDTSMIFSNIGPEGNNLRELLQDHINNQLITRKIAVEKGVERWLYYLYNSKELNDNRFFNLFAPNKVRDKIEENRKQIDESIDEGKLTLLEFNYVKRKLEKAKGRINMEKFIEEMRKQGVSELVINSTEIGGRGLKKYITIKTNEEGEIVGEVRKDYINKIKANSNQKIFSEKKYPEEIKILNKLVKNKWTKEYWVNFINAIRKHPISLMKELVTGYEMTSRWFNRLGPEFVKLYDNFLVKKGLEFELYNDFKEELPTWQTLSKKSAIRLKYHFADRQGYIKKHRMTRKEYDKASELIPKELTEKEEKAVGEWDILRKEIYKLVEKVEKRIGRTLPEEILNYFPMYSSDDIKFINLGAVLKDDIKETPYAKSLKARTGKLNLRDYELNSIKTLNAFLQQMSRYLALAEDSVKLKILFEDKKFKELFKDNPTIVDKLNKWRESIVGSHEAIREMNPKMVAISRYVRAAQYSAILGIKYGVILKQFINLIDVAIWHPIAVGRAAKDILFKQKSDDFIKYISNSSVVQKRIIDITFADINNSLFHFLATPTRKADQFVAKVLKLYFLRQSLENKFNKNKELTEADIKKVELFADKMVEGIMGAMDNVSNPRFLKSELGKHVNMFYGALTAKAGYYIQDIWAKQNPEFIEFLEESNIKTGALSMAAKGVVGLTLGALIEKLITDLFWEDDEKELSIDVLFTLIGNIPILGQVSWSLRHGRAYIPTNAFATLGKIFFELGQIKSSKKEETKKKHLLRLLSLLAGLTLGVPNQVLKSFEGGQAWEKGYVLVNNQKVYIFEEADRWRLYLKGTFGPEKVQRRYRIIKNK